MNRFILSGAIIIKLFNPAAFFPVCSGETRKSQILFIFDGIFINAATVLTTGVFLSGYVVLLKGSDFLVGLLNNSATWASVAAIFSYLIYERMEKRKKLLITLNIVSRLLICSIVFLPLVSKNNNLVLLLLTIMVIVGNIIWSIYNIGITVMMIDLAPSESRNAYIYVRMFWLRISFTIATISMGILLDKFHKSYMGFMIVFLISLALSIADVITLMGVKENVNTAKKDIRFEPSTFFEPVRSRRFCKFLIFIFLYYLCLTTSSSFTNLYLIRYLKFDYSFISLVNVISYTFMILCTNFWSRVEKKYGVRFVMKITALFAISEFIVYSFLTQRTYFLLYFAPVLSGIGNSGFNITILTYRYQIIPENNKTIYEGWFGAVNGLSMLVSPIIGSIILQHLPVFENSVYQHSNFQLLYLLSAVTAIAVVFFSFNSHGKIASGNSNITAADKL